MNSMYFLQLLGKASTLVVVVMEDCHPGSVTYCTSTLDNTSRSAAGNRFGLVIAEPIDV